MSKHAAYVPKHRQAPARPLSAAPRKALHKAVVLSSLAVAATGASVGGGVVLQGSTLDGDAAATVSAPVADAAPAAEEAAASASAAATPASVADADLAEEIAERSQQSVSRSADRRVAVDPAKAAALASAAQVAAKVVTEHEDMANADPRAIASAMLGDYGWGSDQFGCLDSLWTRESNWNPRADNPTSSAYGIPQALPGSKMASAGSDWATNPATQIKWGLGYIEDRYGSPCSAWGHSESNGWY